MRPIAMAEFWYGDSPKGEVRKHGQFYPACVGRCGPILGFMLQGLNVEPNPKEEKSSAFDSIRIICEDDYMIAVDKPSGLLSAPGKVSDVCVQTVLRKIRPESERYFVVHRLDMDTSGVLLLAKDEETYKRLQSMFAGREMKKEYVALLNGVVRDDGGEITLPLSADYVNRPCQKVDFEKGKPAVTVYEVISRRGEETLIRFRPHTGRTHQLRVHSAHNLGLGAPIKGDSLYGTPSDRLYLHAESLTFVHPVTGCDVVIRSECPFSL
jgi:tRNA pseudouridine32 synthase/23S rRNA pseudouridine746 synthase